MYLKENKQVKEEIEKQVRKHYDIEVNKKEVKSKKTEKE